jgi:hypothetical protein
VDSNELNKDNIVDFILDLFERRGAEEYMGEPVSMSQHMEQTRGNLVARSLPNAPEPRPALWKYFSDKPCKSGLNLIPVN